MAKALDAPPLSLSRSFPSFSSFSSSVSRTLGDPKTIKLWILCELWLRVIHRMVMRVRISGFLGK